MSMALDKLSLTAPLRADVCHDILANDVALQLAIEHSCQKQVAKRRHGDTHKRAKTNGETNNAARYPTVGESSMAKHTDNE